MDKLSITTMTNDKLNHLFFEGGLGGFRRNFVNNIRKQNWISSKQLELCNKLFRKSMAGFEVGAHSAEPNISDSEAMKSHDYF